MSKQLIEELKARELLFQTTDENALIKHLENKTVTLYCGFDLTAESIHIGNLQALFTLRRFQDAGHKPIVILGGATSMVGDPSGKSKERPLLSEDQISYNLSKQKKQFENILDFSSNNAAVILDNATWFKNISFLEFLRDVGKHAPMGSMLAKESVSTRLSEQGLSFTEFAYMLLQAYDFYFLYKNHNCTLQIGGSDQWGNITAGIELIRRKLAAEYLNAESNTFGCTLPLLTKADGKKYGKSESGAVWLDPNLTSPYNFYQFFIQTEDSDVIKLLKALTFLPLNKIEELKKCTESEPEKREAQKALAGELTRLVHGNNELIRAEKASQALFEKKLDTLDTKTLLEVLGDAPSTTKDMSTLKDGTLTLLDLVIETNLSKSKGQARKDIMGGGFYFNHKRVDDPSFLIGKEHLIDGKFLLLRKGKKNYHIVFFK